MDSSSRPNDRSTLLRTTILYILFLCAGAEFIARGPIRFAHAPHFNDFISPYIQTRLWIHGQDPYSAQNLVRDWPLETQRFYFLTHELADGTLLTRVQASGNTA